MRLSERVDSKLCATQGKAKLYAIALNSCPACGTGLARSAPLAYAGSVATHRPIMNLPVPVITIGLLLMSNIFMTFAWYGHLKFKTAPLLIVILVSWGIAFFEYLLQVPANRIGHGHFNAAQLKTIQEVLTLSVFAVFSVWYLKEPLGWNHLLGFSFIALGASFIFHKWA